MAGALKSNSKGVLEKAQANT